MSKILSVVTSWSLFAITLAEVGEVIKIIAGVASILVSVVTCYKMIFGRKSG